MSYPGSIQLGINLAQTGGQVDVGAGVFHERLTVNKSLQLRGAQYGVDPTAPGQRLNPSAETILDLVGLSMVFTHRAREFLALAVDLRRAGYGGHVTAGDEAAYEARCVRKDGTVQFQGRKVHVRTA